VTGQATRWQRFCHSMGFTWRAPAECPHPEDRTYQDDGCGYEPAEDIRCLDCGATLYHGPPLDRLTAEGRMVVERRQ